MSRLTSCFLSARNESKSEEKLFRIDYREARRQALLHLELIFKMLSVDITNCSRSAIVFTNITGDHSYNRTYGIHKNLPGTWYIFNHFY